MTTARMAERKRGWFLTELRACGNVSDAARASGISRGFAYKVRGREADFAAAWDEAIDEACDALEAEARRRAVDGVEEAVYHGGKEVGRVRKYSDVLLIFLMKGARPEKYRERTEVIGKGGEPLKFELYFGGVLGAKPAQPAVPAKLHAIVREGHGGGASGAAGGHAGLDGPDERHGAGSLRSGQRPKKARGKPRAKDPCWPCKQQAESNDDL